MIDLQIPKLRQGSYFPVGTRPADIPMSVDSHLLALRTLFDPAAAAGFMATLKLRLGEDRVRFDVPDGRLEIARGEAPSADAVIDTDPPTLLALIRGDDFWRPPGVLATSLLAAEL